MQKRLGAGLDVIGCSTGIIVRANRSVSHSILRDRLGSEIDVMDWRIRRNAENLILKRNLILQSFASLFILLAIKHIKRDPFWHLMVSFIKLFSDKGLVAVSIAVKNEKLGSVNSNEGLYFVDESINCDQYRDVFHTIFMVMDQEQHYKRMMEEVG